MVENRQTKNNGGMNKPHIEIKTPRSEGGKERAGANLACPGEWVSAHSAALRGLGGLLGARGEIIESHLAFGESNNPAIPVGRDSDRPVDCL